MKSRTTGYTVLLSISKLSYLEHLLLYPSMIIQELLHVGQITEFF